MTIFSFPSPSDHNFFQSIIYLTSCYIIHSSHLFLVEFPVAVDTLGTESGMCMVGDVVRMMNVERMSDYSIEPMTIDTFSMYFANQSQCGLSIDIVVGCVLF